jgi:hypothetical protein
MGSAFSANATQPTRGRIMVSANRRDRSFFMMGTSFSYFPLEAGLK